MASIAYKDLDSVDRAAEWLKILSGVHVLPILSYLRSNPGTPAMALYRQVGRRASDGSISVVMRKMSLRELIEGIPDPSNRSIRRYSLTPKGEQVITTLEQMGGIDL